MQGGKSTYSLQSKPRVGSHHPCPSSLQEYGRSAVEPVGKLSLSAAPLKLILPRYTGSRPAMLTGSAGRSCTCVKTVASPALGLMLTHSIARSTAHPDIPALPIHETNKRETLV